MAMRSIRTTVSGTRGISTGYGSARPVQSQTTMTSEERLKRVYSTRRWRALRELVAGSGHYVCQVCGMRAQLIDHIIPINQPFGAMRAFSLANVQPLCRTHHAEKTEEIDAPGGNAMLYRHDNAHRADKRTPAFKRWVEETLAAGIARRVIGEEGMDAEPHGREWQGDISC